MPPGTTSKAIGAVTRALRSRIAARTGINVLIGRPEQNASKGRNLSLFLYEISQDPYLKNFALDEGQKPPLWIVLKYVLTAFDTTGESDSARSHEDLGLALQALYEEDLLKLDGLSTVNIVPALESNPEELHVTFDESSVDLLARLMQGSDEKLRLSIAFQVRPVMISSAKPPDYSLLVGINYTQSPVSLTQQPVGLEVIPSLGSVISEIEPKGFESGETVTIRGTDLQLSGLAVRLGTVDLPITMQRPDQLEFVVDETLLLAAGVSAGSHPVKVVQTLETGKIRHSNMLIGNLVPTLTMAVIDGNISVTAPPAKVFADINLTGKLLGNETDDTVLAFYHNGSVVRVFDALMVPPAAQQTQRRLEMKSSDAVEENEYLMILRVNGQQAPQSPRVNLVSL